MKPFGNRNGKVWNRKMKKKGEATKIWNKTTHHGKSATMFFNIKFKVVFLLARSTVARPITL